MTDEAGVRLVTIQAKMPPMMRYRLEVAAKKAGVSQAEFIRRALDAYMKGAKPCQES